MAMADELAELQAWYAAQCDGDWEHQHGVEIGTLDNPGWRLRIALTDTPLAGRPFAEIRERYEDELRWLRCWVEDTTFHGAGGPAQLGRMLRIFLDWAAVSPAPAAEQAG